MKAAQITQYSKNIHITVNAIPIPETGDYDILIRIKAAAVNPVDIFNLTGAARLIQDYKMPLTLGNECAGIVEKVGRCVKKFKTGDRVYSRLPVSKIGAFAEYVAIHENAAAHMPDDFDFEDEFGTNKVLSLFDYWSEEQKNYRLMNDKKVEMTSTQKIV